MISRERCPQIELNAKSYTAGTTFKQENNSKTHPFPHNNLEPKLGLIRSYNVRKLVLRVQYISEHAHCSLGARRHRLPDINPLMQRGPGHIKSIRIQHPAGPLISNTYRPLFYSGQSLATFRILAGRKHQAEFLNPFIFFFLQQILSILN